ncbi:MAG: hypothetical protein JKY31_10790 [Rhodobacteraceae bacterium]|nr:hypothetical protein [Paracoccaceae bacterium]
MDDLDSRLASLQEKRLKAGEASEHEAERLVRVVANHDKSVRETSLSLDGLETRVGVLSGAIGFQEKGLRRIRLQIFTIMVVTGTCAALILAVAFWLGAQIKQNAQNEASAIRDTNAVEVAQVQQMGEWALADLKIQISEKRAEIEREIGSVGTELTVLTEDRDTVRAELEQFVALRDRVGFQLVEYRGRTVVVVPDGERLRRWRAPELSNLASFNGRLYRLTD